MSSNIIKAPLCYHPPTLLYKLWYYLILCHWSPRSGIHWWHSVFSSSKVLNSPHSFYFSSTLEGVKQPVCAPPLLGWNPALLQRCVSVCLSSCVWWEGEVLSLKACRLLFRWKSTQATASEITCHSNCAVRPESVRERGYGRDGWREYVCRRGGEGVMGADGSWWEWSYSSWAASDCSSW